MDTNDRPAGRKTSKYKISSPMQVAAARVAGASLVKFSTYVSIPYVRRGGPVALNFETPVERLVFDT